MEPRCTCPYEKSGLGVSARFVQNRTLTGVAEPLKLLTKPTHWPVPTLSGHGKAVLPQAGRLREPKDCSIETIPRPSCRVPAPGGLAYDFKQIVWWSQDGRDLKEGAGPAADDAKHQAESAAVGWVGLRAELTAGVGHTGDSEFKKTRTDLRP